MSFYNPNAPIFIGSVEIIDINAQITAINNEINTIQSDINTIQSDISDINSNISDINDQINTIQTNIAPNIGQIYKTDSNYHEVNLVPTTFILLDPPTVPSGLPGQFSQNGDGILTYNGPPGIFQISYNIDSHFVATENLVTFALYINSTIEVPEAQFVSVGTQYQSIVWSAYLQLNTGDIFDVRARIKDNDDILRIQNFNLSALKIAYTS